VTPKKPDKVDIEQLLSQETPPAGAAAGDIEIVEVVGGEPEGAAQDAVVTQVEAVHAAAPAAAADTAAGDGPQAGVAAQNDALLERLKRAHAEHDNYRKRVERGRIEQKEQANALLLQELLPTLDSFERALAAQQEGSANGAEFQAGVALIQRQLLEALMRAGLEPLESVDQPFDPEVHDAVASTPEPGRAPGLVLQVFDRGYRFRGRLLRPARVRVSGEPAGSAGVKDKSGNGSR
jgi:molecular chaperone GrpE